MVDLENFDEATLERAFADLSAEVNADIASIHDVEDFRLHWLGRKQGRLKLISEAWLKSAPPEARKPLCMRFNQLKQQIEEPPSASRPSTPRERGTPGLENRSRHRHHPPGNGPHARHCAPPAQDHA